MMKQYFEEDVLVQKVQSGQMNMHDYVTHHSREWDEEYAEFCEDNGLDPDDESSAEQFLQYKDEVLCQAHLDGEV